MARIQRLLVANRGEIACRIIRTARRMGIVTIAVYSSADEKALHVGMADEAVWIGEPMPADSYLNIERILGAARDSNADALHSGYGFLAENADFAAACAQQGIIFVGPPPDAIRAMGMKGAAREKMAAAGVPVLPGINSIEGDISKAAAEIGYPILIKPAAGGGGKGMQVVHGPDDLEEAIASARRGASTAFGNDSLMAEKYLMAPRHVEVQVFADSHGNCIHLNERDCSLQRRHQKIIEESPAPGLSAATRTAMGDAAVAAARTIGYVGAGTVEFLLGEQDNFYFMEMNTRLQVEHPVTEAVTGFDLVEWQLEVAAGNALPVSQSDVAIHGHAMEARLYAEDPLNNFLPVSGRIQSLSLPAITDCVRIDNGVGKGDLVGVYYDPMLMKLIAWGENRGSAMATLRAALAETHLAGIRTNRDFLCHLLDYEPFRKGALSTDFLDLHLANVFGPPSDRKRRAHIVAVVLALQAWPDAQSPWVAKRNFRLNGPQVSRLTLLEGEKPLDLLIEQRGEVMLITVEGVVSRVTGICPGVSLEFLCDDSPYAIEVYRHGHRLTVVSDSRVMEFSLPLQEAGMSEDEGNVQAPLSGRITAISVAAGQQVSKGETLVIIEAMKMEHTIRAPADGAVQAIHYAVGDLVDEGCELLEFEPASTA